MISVSAMMPPPPIPCTTRRTGVRDLKTKGYYNYHILLPAIKMFIDRAAPAVAEPAAKNIIELNMTFRRPNILARPPSAGMDADEAML